jgi:3-methylfumaryl-CoA hydratase
VNEGAAVTQEVEEADDVVTPAMALAMHGLLDAPGPAPAAGEPLPPLWHWMAFVPRVPQGAIGVDGHPQPGPLLADVAVGRRMFASGEVRLDGPVAIGEPIHRTTSIASIEDKTGRSGSLRFVTVHHVLAGRDRPAIVEDQHLVYRPPVDGPAAGSPDSAPADPEAGQDWAWELVVVPDPTLLFRFSALTYNAHRIHYDRHYATEVEGYSGLVVHGPLQAILLVELCRRHAVERVVGSFRFRAVRPAFDGSALRFVGRFDGPTHVVLAAIDHRGRVTTRADADLADEQETTR